MTDRNEHLPLTLLLLKKISDNPSPPGNALLTDNIYYIYMYLFSHLKKRYSTQWADKKRYSGNKK